MIQIPEQVKDAPIVRMKNAVLVGTMKFTPDRYAALIFQLNNNIDYVKIHAMTKGTASEDEGGDEPEPQPTPTPTPDPSGGGDDSGGSGGGLDE